MTGVFRGRERDGDGIVGNGEKEIELEEGLLQEPATRSQTA